jgi:hypothetical protein
MPHVTIRMAMAAGLALGAGLLAGVPIASYAQPSANLQLPASTTPAATYAQGRAAQATSGGAHGAGASPQTTATAQAIPGSTIAAIVTTLPDGKQQTLLIDGERRVVSVYHIHPTTGEISLKSVRNFRYDHEMDEFGTSSPSPRDIKAMLNR